jgi:hypothetical protein
VVRNATTTHHSPRTTHQNQGGLLMSFGMLRKLLRCLGISAFLWLAMPSWSWAQQGSASCVASFGVPCGVGCQSHHCPPPYKYCVEGPPRICWQHGCPRPICDPCDLPHWGFYETCWNDWPFRPDWTHCPSPPPTALVTLNPYVHPNLPPPGRTLQPGATLQSPRALPPPVFPAPSGAGNLPAPGGFEEMPLLPTPRRLEENRPRPNQ